MQTQDEFAEQYSRAERMRIIIVGTLAGALVVLADKHWLSPGLRAFTANAACRTVLGISGEVVLAYGVFVGLPLLGACVVAATIGRRGLRILRDGQAPPIGGKVMRPTRILRGRRATVAGWLQVLAAAPLVVMVPWGIMQASQWSGHMGQRSATQCVTGRQSARDDRVGSASSPDAAR